MRVRERLIGVREMCFSSPSIPLVLPRAVGRRPGERRTLRLEHIDARADAFAK